MKEFFASLYEWFGTLPFYSLDMGYLLQGMDVTCSNGFIGTPWYSIIGISMVLSTILFYLLQYHIIDSSNYNKAIHWWYTVAALSTINFLIAFFTANSVFDSGDYCVQQLVDISTADCFGFGISNAIWSFLFYMLLTSFPFPRQVIPAPNGTCRNTTFWKP